MLAPSRTPGRGVWKVVGAWMEWLLHSEGSLGGGGRGDQDKKRREESPSLFSCLLVSQYHNLLTKDT